MKRILAIVLAVMLLVGCSAEIQEIDEANEVISPASSEKVASNYSGSKTEESVAETVAETKTVETTAEKSSNKTTSVNSPSSNKSESGSSSTNNSQSSNSTSKPSYKNVISQAIKEAEAYSPYEDPQGVLYDVDGNGVEELIMIFSSVNGTNPYDGQTVPAALYSVYTISGNKVVALLDREQLFTEAGGPLGVAYILKNGSETLLCFEYSEINPGSSNGELYVHGDWHIYKVNGSKIDKVKTVNYSYVSVSDDNGNTYSIKYDESTATINNSKKPYKEFEQWLDSYDSTLLFRSYGRDDSTSLETLLNEIN